MSVTDPFSVFLDKYCRQSDASGTLPTSQCAVAPVTVTEVRERLVRTPALFEISRECLAPGEVEAECLEWILEFLDKQ